jgi:transposase
MKTSIVKKDNLTDLQSCLWDAVTSSPHSLSTICKRSGYSYQSFKNWMRGVYEPSRFAFENIIECIQVLENEPPVSINWQTRKPELISMKLKGMSNKVIAAKMNTTRLAIERASKRFGV